MRMPDPPNIMQAAKPASHRRSKPYGTGGNVFASARPAPRKPRTTACKPMILYSRLGSLKFKPASLPKEIRASTLCGPYKFPDDEKSVVRFRIIRTDMQDCMEPIAFWRDQLFGQVGPECVNCDVCCHLAAHPLRHMQHLAVGDAISARFWLNRRACRYPAVHES
jgi:hypothetical protein